MSAIDAMGKGLLAVLVTAVVAAVAGPARGELVCGELDPADTRDPELPPGFQAVTWGMSGEAVQAIRGKPMEYQADLYNEEVHSLWEEFDDGITVRVQYTFFRDRLCQVTRYLDPGLLDTPESMLIARFDEEHGPHADRRTIRDHSGGGTGDPQADPIVEKAWLWCDRFTELVLLRKIQDGELLVRATSRYYRHEIHQAMEASRDQGRWQRLDGLFPE